jgi:hypothetical protein
MITNNVGVKPWIGREYAHPNLFDFKVLLLGESNYTEAGKFTPDIVINCVKDAIDGTDPSGFGRFSTKIIRIIFGKETKITAEDFWSNVAFFNYVQYSVGEASRIRPTDFMWSNSEKVFKENVLKLRPDRLLVLGSRNWENLLRHVSHKDINAYQAELQIDSSFSVLAGYVHHPSSSLRYDIWHPIAKTLLFPG